MDGAATPVVDLTTSPPAQPNAADSIVLLSSDDEENAPLPSTAVQNDQRRQQMPHWQPAQSNTFGTQPRGLVSVPTHNRPPRYFEQPRAAPTARIGMRGPPQVIVGRNRLAPIQTRQEGENRDFQRVNSLRHVLRVDSTRRRPLLWASLAQRGGAEGDSGVRPIRAQPLPRQSRTWSRAPERYRPRAATAGEEVDDGAIDVEAVDDSQFDENVERYTERMRQTRAEMSDEEETFNEQARQYMTRAMAARFGGDNMPIFPFHPGLQIHHFAGNHDMGPSPFDFVDGDDLADILSFLEANAPPTSTTRQGRAMQPLKLNSLQLELAKKPEFTRSVPETNYRDADPELITSDARQIVCVECKDVLYAQDPIWAPSCGHVFCNSCCEAFKGQYKKCSACGKRTARKNLVHLFP
ncbi:hypothetical protein FBU59_002054 [Linderina macrospora]|uniref:Uncharacterized protein n=1 Tax=Linderina macrospora TaxID=4868 RepID=A0ACC1JCJ7_9FUNG|nr:hypothetical protein FBU59_002054 [Linderina macrospora]